MVRLSLRPVHGRCESLKALEALFVEIFTVRLFSAVGKRALQLVGATLARDTVLWNPLVLFGRFLRHERRCLMPSLMGALIGAAIDRDEGGSGIKGAIEGTIAEWAIRTIAPIIATYALGRLVEYGARKGWQTLVGHDPVDERGNLRTRSA
jgi:hypothetical protein